MKTHKFDTLSFVSGLVFTGFGLLFLIPNHTDDLIDSLVDIGSWAWPLILLGVGLAILMPLFLSRGELEGDDAELEMETAQAD